MEPLSLPPISGFKPTLPGAQKSPESVNVAKLLIQKYQTKPHDQAFELIQKEFKFKLPGGEIDKATINGEKLSEVMKLLPHGSQLVSDLDLIFATKLQLEEFKSMSADDEVGNQTAAEYRDLFTDFTGIKLTFANETQSSTARTRQISAPSQALAGLNECFLNTALKALELPEVSSFYLNEIEKALQSLTGENLEFAKELRNYLLQVQNNATSNATKRDVVNAFYNAYKGSNDIQRGQQSDTIQFIRAISDIMEIKPLEISSVLRDRTDGEPENTEVAQHSVLSIPANNSLQESLDLFREPETVQVGNGTANRVVSTNTPPVLFIQLNEGVLQDGYQKTRTLSGQHYGLPSNISDEPVRFQGQEYNIVGKIDHIGSSNGGHYELRTPAQRIAGHITGLVLVANYPKVTNSSALVG